MLPILGLMADNIANGPSTVRFPGIVPAPNGFRGLLHIDASHCLACGMCAYVCVSDAITGLEQAESYQWSYEPGRCTFCARCVERCPGQALAMAAEPAPSYAQRGALALTVQVPFPACPDCGKPTRNATDEWLRSAFGNVDDKVRDLARLCARCRRRQVQRGLIAVAGDGI